MSINHFLSLFWQHIVSVLSCSGGSTLPLHLAAYVHPCAPTLHAGYCLHPYPLYSWPTLQLSASTQGAAHRGGKMSFCCLWCTDCGALDSFPSLNNNSRKWHHSPSALPSGPGCRPRQQPLSTTGRNHSNIRKTVKIHQSPHGVTL